MQLLIKGYSFSLSAPYEPGHCLTADEASALNDLRKENIQNNFRPQVADQVSRLAPGELMPQHVHDGLQAKLAEYDQTYQFAQKSGRSRIGDIDREARTIATDRVRHELEQAQQNNPAFQPVSWTADKTDALVAEYEKLPAVLEEARIRVAARRSALAGGMESL